MGQIVNPSITASTIINPVNVTGANPRIIFTETDVPAGMSKWDINVNVSTFAMRTRNAADTLGVTFFEVAQNLDNTVSNMTLGDLDDVQSVVLNAATIISLDTLDGGVSLLGGFFNSSLNVRLTTVGTGLRVAEGANAKQGLTAAMVAGTLVVANTSVTANSRILLTRQSGGTNPGAVFNSARTPGVSFTVTSTNAADTGQVAFEIFEPA